MSVAAGSGTVGDEEDQEDSSSSSQSSFLDVTLALGQVNLTDTKEEKSVKDELSEFRQQWQRELEQTPPPNKENKKIHYQIEETDTLINDEEKAKKLFLLGIELERSGKLYEAIQHYKRAIQILPDVETRLYEDADLRPESPKDEEHIDEECPVCEEEESDDEDSVEGEDLFARLQRILATKGHFCQPAIATKEAHISWLPMEVIQYLLRWLVGAELDAAALDVVSGVCRGLYVAAREHHIWRSICIKTWGVECGTPRAHGFSSWRQMYVDRPRLNLHGCYISKTTYLRHGENSFQDVFYRPWYLIDYYRYLRFFPEGHVLMWTTAEEPASCVGHLRTRVAKNNLGIMGGHYRLVGNKVVILIKKIADKKSSQGSRFRARRKEPHELCDQTYQLELQLRTVRGRRNAQLSWRYYAVCKGCDQWTSFELVPGKFPPFSFSRVRSYTSETSAPMLCSVGS